MTTFRYHSTQTSMSVFSPEFHRYGMGPAIKGTIAGVAGQLYMGGSIDKVPLFGMGVSPGVIFGVTVAAGSITSELAHDFVLDRIHGNGRWAAAEKMALAPALTAAGSIGAGYLLIGSLDARGMLELAALGAGSEVAGAYTHGFVMSAINGSSAVSAVM